MAQIVVGVDPGARYTGIVVRRGDELLDHVTLTRTSEGKMPDHGYLHEVALAVVRRIDTFGATGAIEAVREPSPFTGPSGVVKFSNVGGILGTGMVYGAVLALVPCVVVQPARNGRRAMASYPEALRPLRGQGKGSDSLRHMRSAWDVAGTAVKMAVAA